MVRVRARLTGTELTALDAHRVFNTGSPYNVPAGHGGANLDKLIAHYENKNFEEQAKKLQALREGSIERAKEDVAPVVKNAPNP